MNGKQPPHPINLAFSWIPLKAVEFYGVDTTSFLKDFVVLMYLFKFNDFLKLNCLKKEESHCCLKNYLKLEKFFLESSRFNAFDTFLAQFFS